MKFVVMTVATLGVYHLYWIYGNWRLLREREREPLNPMWRTFFAFVTVYRMFERGHESAVAAGVRARWSALGLAVAYFVANLAAFVGIPVWLVGAVLLLPVLPVQMTMAKVNAAVAPGAPRNDRFTLTDFALIAAGAALTAWLYSQDRMVDALLKEWNP